MAKGMLSGCGGEKQQATLLLLLQVIVIALMGSLMTYGPEARPNTQRHRPPVPSPSINNVVPVEKNSDDGPPPLYPRLRSAHAASLLFIQGFVIVFMIMCKYTERQEYGMASELPVSHALYQDVHVMIWIGFGFLMTFLRRYGQSAVGFTFLIGAILVQVAMVYEALFNMGTTSRAPLSLESLLNADVAVAAPLISMGAMLGKTSYMQLIVMGVIELGVYTVNKHIGENHFVAVDAGDSMYVHAFGAYFGLAVSFIFGMKEKPKENSLEGSSYESDIFAMIGTVFLWLFWPSFNSSALKGDEQRRAIINTLLSITASCVIAFAVSALVSKSNKFNMVHVQNSTLAGGVAIGTAAGMMCEPYGALLIGSIGGAVSVFGYKVLTPLIQKRIRIHDTCGVHNLHGMPAIIAGLFGAFFAGIATEEVYDYSLYEIFPARIPGPGPNLTEINENYRLQLKPGLNRSAGQQAAYQLLALVVTLAVAIVSGLITGLILKLPCLRSVTEDEKFDDSYYWELEDENANKDDSSHITDQHVMNQM